MILCLIRNLNMPSALTGLDLVATLKAFEREVMVVLLETHANPVDPIMMEKIEALASIGVTNIYTLSDSAPRQLPMVNHTEIDTATLSKFREQADTIVSF